MRMRLRHVAFQKVSRSNFKVDVLLEVNAGASRRTILPSCGNERAQHSPGSSKAQSCAAWRAITHWEAVPVTRDCRSFTWFNINLYLDILVTLTPFALKLLGVYTCS